MNTAYPLFSRQASLILPAGVVTIKPVSKPDKYEMYRADLFYLGIRAGFIQKHDDKRVLK